MRVYPHASMKERFGRFVSPEPNTGCWLWAGAIDRFGYGRTQVSRKRAVKNFGAHRVAWELHHGPIAPGLSVCHRCDVRSCVNPEHMFLGTQSDNNADMTAKGRGVQLRGTAHPRSKLTGDKAEEIRRRYATERITQDQLAAEFGVCPSLISGVVTRKLWCTT